MRQTSEPEEAVIICSYRRCNGKCGAPRHVYRIVRRGAPIEGKHFCSSHHAQLYIKRLRGEWEVRAEWFSWRKGKRLTVHFISIESRKQGFVVPREIQEFGDE